MSEAEEEFQELVSAVEDASDEEMADAESKLCDFVLSDQDLIIRALRYANTIENHPELPAAIADKMCAFALGANRRHVEEIVEAVFISLRKAFETP